MEDNSVLLKGIVTRIDNLVFRYENQVRISIKSKKYSSELKESFEHHNLFLDQAIYKRHQLLLDFGMRQRQKLGFVGHLESYAYTDRYGRISEASKVVVNQIVTIRN